MDPALPTFKALLTPHRSLTREGFVALMAIIIGVNLIGGAVFFIAGAWPVTGFMGLDAALVWWAFRANFSDARRLERIEVTDRELILQRRGQGQAPQELRFTRAWVKVELEEDRERELIGRLFLTSSGRRTEIGSFLGPEERKSFAHALKAALTGS